MKPEDLNTIVENLDAASEERRNCVSLLDKLPPHSTEPCERCATFFAQVSSPLCAGCNTGGH